MRSKPNEQTAISAHASSSPPRSVPRLGLAHGIPGYLLSMTVPGPITVRMVLGPHYGAQP